MSSTPGHKASTYSRRWKDRAVVWGSQTRRSTATMSTSTRSSYTCGSSNKNSSSSSSNRNRRHVLPHLRCRADRDPSGRLPTTLSTRAFRQRSSPGSSTRRRTARGAAEEGPTQAPCPATLTSRDTGWSMQRRSRQHFRTARASRAAQTLRAPSLRRFLRRRRGWLTRKQCPVTDIPRTICRRVIPWHRDESTTRCQALKCNRANELP